MKEKDKLFEKMMVDMGKGDPLPNTLFQMTRRNVEKENIEINTPLSQ
jgi:hypothetical protein